VQTGQIGGVAQISTASISGDFVNASGAATTLNLSTFSITGADGKAVTLSGTAGSAQDVADAINSAGLNGVSAAVNSNGGLNIFSTGTLSISGGAAAATSLNGANTGALGSAGASGSDGTALTGSALTTTVSGSLQGGDVLTVDDANKLIASIDAALTTVSNISSTLGAVQNRFQSTIATLSAQSTNLQASQSSIQDADFAQETANLSKAQVLQQAGISVLATANAQPQQVLKLLQ
jgi:flagellin